MRTYRDGRQIFESPQEVHKRGGFRIKKWRTPSQTEFFLIVSIEVRVLHVELCLQRDTSRQGKFLRIEIENYPIIMTR
jgi:hypothetical protein